MPILYVEAKMGLRPVMSLVNYIIERNADKSEKWIRNLYQGAIALLDFISANPGYSNKPAKMYREFVQSFQTGSVDIHGDDPSQLYWLARSPESSRKHLKLLDRWLDYASEKTGGVQVNPFVQADAIESHINRMAYLKRTEKAVLGHLNSKAGAFELASSVREVLYRRPPPSPNRAKSIAFPEDRFYDQLFEGYVIHGREKETDPLKKYNWQALLINTLMNSGGVRISEPFHIWVDDIIEDPENPGSALVRIYHPEFGAPPRRERGEFKRTYTREAYLQANYPGVLPRNRASGNYFAGWKGAALDPSTKHFQVYWFPTADGKLFWKVWKIFIKQRIDAGIDCSLHPFAFVNLDGKYKGRPYTIDTFRSTYKRAVERIGLIPRRSLGTMPHNNRHAYGHRATAADIDNITLKTMFHHINIESQETYRGISDADINKILTDKSELLNQRGSSKAPI
jgi:hypothetical protein